MSPQPQASSQKNTVQDAKMACQKNASWTVFPVFPLTADAPTTKPPLIRITLPSGVVT